MHLLGARCDVRLDAESFGELRGQLAQPFERVAGLALHRADRAVHDVGGLHLGEVLVETQHQHLPLPGGEPGERVLDDQAPVSVGERVSGYRQRSMATVYSTWRT